MFLECSGWGIVLHSHSIVQNDNLYLLFLIFVHPSSSFLSVNPEAIEKMTSLRSGVKLTLMKKSKRKKKEENQMMIFGIVGLIGCLLFHLYSVSQGISDLESFDRISYVWMFFSTVFLIGVMKRKPYFIIKPLNIGKLLVLLFWIILWGGLFLYVYERYGIDVYSSGFWLFNIIFTLQPIIWHYIFKFEGGKKSK